MRILILLDQTLGTRKQEVENALLKIREDYTVATPVEWIYEVRDFSTIPWVSYQPGALGISFDVIEKDTQGIYLRDGEKWDNVIYVVAPANWKAEFIGGWNLGYPRHGYTIELVLAHTNPSILYKIFAMEIAHSWNDLCIQEINDNLLPTFGVTDFDNQVIHGVDPRYGKNVPPNAPMDGYYTDYNYRPMIEVAKAKLSLAYQIRKTRYNTGAFIFKRDLHYGMSGDDVIELQKRFAREGLATYAPTGFFGVLTKASSTAYQKKNNIFPQMGYVGPKTRLSLNKTSVVSTTTNNILAEADAILLSELAIWG